MRQQKSKLAQRNINVKVVTFDPDLLAIAYVKETKLSWPLLQDSNRELYSAYDMQRGTWWAISNPVAIWKYLKLFFAGRRAGKLGSDLRQLGGDVLIDPRGIVRLHHVSTGPHDRPSVEAILDLTSPKA